MTRVFIISGYPMFSWGLESLLRQGTGLDITGRETDVDRAIEQIKALQPDVVILDSSSSDDNSRAVVRILKENLGTRVVNLSLQDNLMVVYQAAQWAVQDVDDLVDVIGQRHLSAPHPG